MTASRASRMSLVLIWALLEVVGLPTASADGATIRERRVLFEEDFSWVTKSGADELIDRAKRAGFDSLVICVWHGRGVTWPSALTQREPRWSAARNAEPDPLGYVIRQAHAQGMEVHAWFAIALRQAEIFPQYFDGTGYGDEIPKSFNVHRPEFRDFIVNVVSEVAGRYPVDGINLDYIRSGGVCTSHFCQELYGAQVGRNLLSDVKNMHDSKEAWSAISNWNANAVQDIVARISTLARSRKPAMLVSVDSHIGKREFELQGADSAAWVNRGFVDVIYDMNYERYIDQERLNDARKRLRDQRRMVLLVGNFERSMLQKEKVFSRDASRVRELMRLSARFGRRGFGSGLYTYKYLSKEQVELLSELSGSGTDEMESRELQ